MCRSSGVSCGDFFGFSPREAEILDPQSRVFLECCWEALESAGAVAEPSPGWIGLYGGVSWTSRDITQLWYPSHGFHGPRGILFLDEITSAPPTVTAAAYQLILDRRLGEYRIPDGWVIFAAGNRLGDRGVTYVMPAPLANRFTHYEIEPHLDDWVAWALASAVDERVIAFLRFRPDLLFHFDPAQHPIAFPSPRSWEYAHRALAKFGDATFAQSISNMLARDVLHGTAQEDPVKADNRDSGLEALLQAAKKAPMLTAEEELRLAKEASAGSGAGFERLLKSHLRLVLTIAHEFSAYGLPLDDLVSEGLLGLVEAARRYDPERGVRLAAYAAWWIRAYMRRYTIFNRRIVRTPSSRHGRKLLANLRRIQREVAQTTGERPDAETVAKLLGVGVRDVRR